MMPRKIIIASILLALSMTARAATYYISPNGNNANDGLSSGAPKKTFAGVFSSMGAGDTLVLVTTAPRTTYSAAGGTGYMSYDDGTCATCGQVPVGTSTSAMTIIKTDDATRTVIVDGGARSGLFVGRSNRKDKFIKVQDIRFEGGGELYNSDHVYLKNCGFHSATSGPDDVFDIGTNDGNWGNSYDLVEDCWIWGKERGIAANYRGFANIWRRVVIRGDGCGSANCTGSGNPNIGFTLYNSSYNSVQNMMIVDRVLGGGFAYADFASAQHNAGPNDMGAREYNKNNEWLGCLSLNSADTGYQFEADNSASPTIKMRNCVAWKNNGGGFNIGTAATGVDVQNITAVNSHLSGESNIRMAPGVTGTLANIVASTCAQWGVNSAVTPSYSDVFNASVDAYNQTSCSVGCLTSNPQSDGTPASIKYIPQIETGSALKGTGNGGVDYGANLIYQYGTDGAFADMASSNTLSAVSLWPWPNQSKIKSDFAESSTAGFAGASTTLTQYVWDFAGNTDGAFGSTAPSVGGGSSSSGHFQTTGAFQFSGSVTIR